MSVISIFHRREYKILGESIITSHSLARELLSKEDYFITVTKDDKEYYIKNIKRVATHANRDDGVCHLTLNIEETKQGNIIR